MAEEENCLTKTYNINYIFKFKMKKLIIPKKNLLIIKRNLETLSLIERLMQKKQLLISKSKGYNLFVCLINYALGLLLIN